MAHMETQRFCTCCFFPVNKSKIPLLDPIEKLSFLGMGIPLYFYLIIIITVQVTIMYLISGIVTQIEIWNFCKGKSNSFINFLLILEYNIHFQMILGNVFCLQGCLKINRIYKNIRSLLILSTYYLWSCKFLSFFL